jgi:hypothetical protein
MSRRDRRLNEQRLLVAIFPTVPERILSWVAAQCYRRAETGPVVVLGEVAERLHMKLQDVRARWRLARLERLREKL